MQQCGAKAQVIRLAIIAQQLVLGLWHTARIRARVAPGGVKRADQTLLGRLNRSGSGYRGRVLPQAQTRLLEKQESQQQEGQGTLDSQPSAGSGTQARLTETSRKVE